MDPQVLVEIHGVAIDKARKKTHRIDNNGNKFSKYLILILQKKSDWVNAGTGIKYREFWNSYGIKSTKVY